MLRLAHELSTQSKLVKHPHATPVQWVPALQVDWQLRHCPPDPPHCVSRAPATQAPPVARLVQQPPLQPVFAPPQSPWHECRVSEHAASDGQSAATLQPHRPLTQALPTLWPAQLVQRPPLAPQAAPAVPVTQVPPEQQPPLQG